MSRYFYVLKNCTGHMYLYKFRNSLFLCCKQRIQRIFFQEQIQLLPTNYFSEPLPNELYFLSNLNWRVFEAFGLYISFCFFFISNGVT